MRPTALAILVVMLAAACGKERPVEAPIVDVAIGGWDASARPLVIETAPAQEEPRSESSGITGRWEGIGRQDDGQIWPMVVEISTTNMGACATVDYPSVPCRAEWLCLGEQRGTLQARERLLDDSASRCIDNGTMTMHVAEGGILDWTWSGQGQSARARLRRTR
jgi:hypothetical protein